MKTLEQLGISPSPWIEKVWATSDDYGHDVADRNHRSICDMRLLQGETRIPNALLIAAAPELYDALYKITKEQECGRDCMKCKNHGCVIKECKAALDKAAGESEARQ